MPDSISYQPVGEPPGSAHSSSWLTWLKKEMTWNKKLIPIKITQFLYAGGTNSMLPYLTLHMKELGLSMEEIGAIYAVLPIATILGPPLSGLMADRTGNYKLVVLLNMLMTLVLHLALFYLPGEGPNQLHFFCGGGGIEGATGPQNGTLLWDKCRPCHDEYENMNFTVTLKNCKFMCDNPIPSNPFEFCLNSGNTSSGFCELLNFENQTNINGTLSSTREGNICSHAWYEIHHQGSDTLQSIQCPSIPCPVECDVERPPACAGRSSYVFWVYFPVRLIATFFLSSLFTMMDAVTLAIVNEHGGEYGKQRFLFILGMATVPLAAGFLNDWDAGRNGTSFYLPAMYLGAAFCITASVFIARLKFKVETGKGNVLQDLKKLVTKPEVNIYFLIVLILGSNWGFIESYLFLYLGDLGAPNYLMGLTMTVGSLVGLPVMFIADKVVLKIGRHNIFIISFFAYALRHFGYSFIRSPWLVFPFELLEVFTYQLMWVAAVTFCPILAPAGMLATMTGVAGAVHFSIGRGVGSFIGGQLISQLDLPRAFRVYGGIAIAAGILYILVHIFYFKKKIAIAEAALEKSKREIAETEMGSVDTTREDQL